MLNEKTLQISRISAVSKFQTAGLKFLQNEFAGGRKNIIKSPTMKYPAFSREKLSMNRSTGCGLKLKKPEKIRLTSSIPEARKNIQALQTNKKVRTVAGILDIFKFNSLLHIRWTTTARPCNAPQIIIIQLAPVCGTEQAG